MLGCKKWKNRKPVNQKQWCESLWQFIALKIIERCFSVNKGRKKMWLETKMQGVTYLPDRRYQNLFDPSSSLLSPAYLTSGYLHAVWIGSRIKYVQKPISEFVARFCTSASLA
jgi:hypothetical protein